jgi:ABC-type sugar transport system ATPase subunit
MMSVMAGRARLLGRGASARAWTGVSGENAGLSDKTENRRQKQNVFCHSHQGFCRLANHFFCWSLAKHDSYSEFIDQLQHAQIFERGFRPPAGKPETEARSSFSFSSHLPQFPEHLEKGEVSKKLHYEVALAFSDSFVMASLKLKNIVKQFGQTQVIHGISLEIEDGEFLVFVGPSGCGKTTMLRIIAGLEETTEGEIWIGNRKVNNQDPATRGVAMVFQSFALYPHMNVEENMGFGLRMAKRPKHEIKERVARAAEILQLTPLLHRRPKHLSGGQKQRVAIGRAIVREPEVFLFDEPLSNLDIELRVQMRIELSKLHSELQATMVYVTHDQMEAMTLADRIVVLNSGRIEQVGRPQDLYQRPDNLFVAGFMGAPRMNFLKVRVSNSTAGTVVVESADFPNRPISVEKRRDAEIAYGSELTFGVRPEHLEVCEIESGISTLIIEVVENLGDMTYIHGMTPAGNRLSLSINGFQTYRHADSVGFRFETKNVHLFAGNGEAV